MGICGIHWPGLPVVCQYNTDGAFRFAVYEKHQYFYRFSGWLHCCWCSRLHRWKQHHDGTRYHLFVVNSRTSPTPPVPPIDVLLDRVHTFKIRVYPPAILPMLAVYGDEKALSTCGNVLNIFIQFQWLWKRSVISRPRPKCLVLKLMEKILIPESRVACWCVCLQQAMEL